MGKISVVGHVYKWEYNAVSMTLKIWPSEQALDKSKITVTIQTAPLKGQEQAGSCKKSILVNCEECECIGSDPDVYSTDEEVARLGTENMWVDSGGLACPPFTWTVSGTGFSLSKATTDSDMEINVLSADGTACGSATITVTDACGRTAIGYVRCTTGEWCYGSVASQDCPNDGAWYYTILGKYLYRIKLNTAFVSAPDCDPSTVGSGMGPCHAWYINTGRGLSGWIPALPIANCQCNACPAVDPPATPCRWYSVNDPACGNQPTSYADYYDISEWKCSCP